ncbi:TSUP family transporter [Corynebacterium coyleae]
MLAFLIAASAFAGWIDAVIGGGGLVLIPILMATTGMPAASVLATNKVAAISGTASAAVSLVRRVGVPKFTWIYALIAGIAAALGATAVSLIDDSVANPIIITLLIAVGIFVVVKPTFGTTGKRRVSSIRIALGIAAAALIGAYDGIFGPGTGMFLIMAFTAIFTQQFLQSAAMAKVVNTATNLGALIVFGLGGYIDWKLALILAVANVIGAQIGTRTVLKGGSKLVRIALLILVVVLCVKLLKDQGAIG